MKTKARKMILGLGLALSASYAQAQGLEGIIVEKYYVPNAADIANATSNGATVPLTSNSVTYRVYVDMAAGWKFSLLKGNSFHGLKINTSTQFYNDPNNGVVVGAQATSTLNVRKNTVMIDSWLTTGGTAVGKVGVIESQDIDGSLGNAQNILQNNPGGAYGAPINGAGAADGMINGTTSAPTVLGFGTATDIFDQTPGGSFIVNNGAMAILGGALGYGPNNTMLLGQFTTDGVFSFELNIQLINPSGTAVEYVANSPQAGETVYSGLTYSVCPPNTSTLTALSSTNTCVGNTVALSTNTISGASYTWYNGSTPISGATTETYNAAASGNYSVNLNYFGCSVSSNTMALVFNSLPTLTLTTSSSTICAAQTASLNVSGASTYTWSTGSNNASYPVTPLVNTIYSVTGTDANNCLSPSYTISIAVNPTPTVQIAASTLAICPGETSTLTLTGASTYTWSDNSNNSSYTVSPTTNTTYSVTGSDVNGCIGNSTITITAKPSPTITISASNTVICSGNSSLLSANGANTYTWTSGPTSASYTVSPLTNASYTITGTDLNNCWSESAITISVNITPTVSATASSGSICAGQTATLTASGASTYSWVTSGNTSNSEVVSPVINTNYIVIGTDNGCSATASVQIVANPTPTISVVSSNTLICTGEVVILTANTNGTSYTWSNAATTSSISISPSVTTVYSVTVSDGVCSSNSSITQSVSACTFVNQLEAVNSINVYPNPFNNSLEILVNNNEQNKSITINIYNVLGENVYSQKSLDSKTIINTTDLRNGTYYIRVNDKVYKVIKQD